MISRMLVCTVCFRVTVSLLFALFVASALGQDSKRGWAGNDANQANAANARWCYNWGFEPPTGLHGEYVPMFWSRFGIQTRINTILGYENVNYVLGFNEPERSDQANMTVAEAIDIWAEICSGLDGTGIKLVSPAVSDTVNGRAWLNEFMQQAEANNLVVDEVAFHWYGFVDPDNPIGSANSFLNKVDQYYNSYDRNVWVTEFAGLDFAGSFSTEQMQQANAIFLSVAIAGLESRAFVTRYSMWAFSDDSQPLFQNARGDWNPTIVGDSYIPTLFSDDELELNAGSIATDTAYLRGGAVSSNPTVNGESLLRISALPNADGSVATSSFGGAFDWALANEGSISTELNSVLRKVGENEISVRNANIYNHGLIENEQGTLWLHGGETQINGLGEIHLKPGSTLRLGEFGDDGGFALASPLKCFGGVIETTGNDVVLAGDATIFAQTRFVVEGELRINGVLMRPSSTNGSGIVKQGDGELILTSDHNFEGNAIVNEGTLTINGTIESNLLLNQGIVRGTGTINGSSEVRGRLQPGFNIGEFNTELCEFFPGSTMEIDLGPFGANDKLNVIGPLIIHDDVTLKLSLVDDFSPTVGDAFDILDALVVAGQFDQIEFPKLDDGEWNFDLLGSFGIVSIIESFIVVGDINHDGVVNLLDVAPFVALLTSGEFVIEGDINKDGVINLLDVAPFVDLLAG